MENTTQISTEAAVVADLTRKSCEPKTIEVASPDGTRAVVLLVPNNLNLVDLSSKFDEDRGHPVRAKGVQTVHSIDSFIQLVTLRALREGEEVKDVIVYLDNSGQPAFTAVLNEHGSVPGFRDYKIVYAPKLSREWKVWTGSDGKTMTQADFGEFLEAQCLDIIDLESVGETTKNIVAQLGVSVASPPGLKALARDFTVKVKQEVREARALSSGETQIVFKTEHAGEDGRPLTVPGAFLVAIPIFENGPAYTLVARLRYRVTEGRVVWAYHLEQTDKSQKDCLDGMAATIKGRLPFPLIEGCDR